MESTVIKYNIADETFEIRSQKMETIKQIVVSVLNRNRRIKK